MATVEACQKDLYRYIRHIFIRELKKGETRYVRKHKSSLTKDFGSYCQQHNMHSFYGAVMSSTNVDTNAEGFERIVREIAERDLSPEQRNNFNSNFEFYAQRVGIVNTDTYWEDMEWMIENSVIDLASGEFKEGKGARGAGTLARRRLRTQKKYEEIIDGLHLPDRENFQSKVTEFETKLEQAKDRAKEKRIKDMVLQKRMERLRSQNDGELD